MTQSFATHPTPTPTPTPTPAPMTRVLVAGRVISIAALVLGTFVAMVQGGGGTTVILGGLGVVLLVVRGVLARRGLGLLPRTLALQRIAETGALVVSWLAVLFDSLLLLPAALVLTVVLVLQAAPALRMRLARRTSRTELPLPAQQFQFSDRKRDLSEVKDHPTRGPNETSDHHQSKTSFPPPYDRVDHALSPHVTLHTPSAISA